jgi:hypothetical protein
MIAGKKPFLDIMARAEPATARLVGLAWTRPRVFRRRAARRHVGIVVLRLATQNHAVAASELSRVLALLSSESLMGSLWIVEDHRIRIHDA